MLTYSKTTQDKTLGKALKKESKQKISLDFS